MEIIDKEKHIVRCENVKSLDASTDKVLDICAWKEARHLYAIASKFYDTANLNAYYEMVRDKNRQRKREINGEEETG